jgi:hypothetical protein
MKRTFIDLFIDRSNPKRNRRRLVSLLVWGVLLGDVALNLCAAINMAGHDIEGIVAALLTLFCVQFILVCACWGLWELKKYMTKLIIKKLGL